MKLNFDDLYRAIDKVKSKGLSRPVRIVSYREYIILEDIANCGKLNKDGYPAFNFWKEYIDRLYK